MQNAQALQSGTKLRNYRIEDVLGAGGFGITYRARDTRLDTTVAVKEYFPCDHAMRRSDHTITSMQGGSAAELFDWGRRKFRVEADTLAKLRHRNIVGVNYLFEANGTSYMVLDYIDGGSMKDWLKRLNRTPTQAELDALLLPLMDALAALHDVGVLHRDIAPKNIMLEKPLTPILIDFGAVREVLAQRTQTVANMLTRGYAPQEQYANSGQGPWTDIYALAATFYECISGNPPPDAVERVMEDRCKPAAAVARASYDPHLLALIDWGLRQRPKDRPQSVREWRDSYPRAAYGHEFGDNAAARRTSWFSGWFGRG